MKKRPVAARNRLVNEKGGHALDESLVVNGVRQCDLVRLGQYVAKHVFWRKTGVGSIHGHERQT